MNLLPAVLRQRVSKLETVSQAHKTGTVVAAPDAYKPEHKPPMYKAARWHFGGPISLS
jgi:hypothetical protein